MTLDRLLEHLEPHRSLGPAVAEDVLVQVLARPDPEEEPAGHERGRRRGGMRDHRRMRPDQSGR